MVNAIHELAVNKAFATISMLLIRVKDAKKDIETGNIGPISMDELHLLHNGYKKELTVWNYIAATLEKTEK